MIRRTGDVVTTVAPGVVTACIDRPGAGNAMRGGVLDGLAAALEVAERSEAAVFVVTGAGGTFCAGTDPAELGRGAGGAGRMERFATRFGEVLDRLETAPFATVALVEGCAVASGCELVLACDVAVAATTARLGASHIEHGFVPSAGASVRLCRNLPKARARYLLLSGAVLSAARAERWGLLTLVVRAEDLPDTAGRVVARIAGHRHRDVAVVKRLATNAARLSQEQALPLERTIATRHATSVADGTPFADPISRETTR